MIYLSVLTIYKCTYISMIVRGYGVSAQFTCSSFMNKRISLLLLLNNRIAMNAKETGGPRFPSVQGGNELYE